MPPIGPSRRHGGAVARLGVAVCLSISACTQLEPPSPGPGSQRTAPGWSLWAPPSGVIIDATPWMLRAENGSASEYVVLYRRVRDDPWTGYRIPPRSAATLTAAFPSEAVTAEIRVLDAQCGAVGSLESRFLQATVAIDSEGEIEILEGLDADPDGLTTLSGNLDGQDCEPL